MLTAGGSLGFLLPLLFQFQKIDLLSILSGLHQFTDTDL